MWCSGMVRKKAAPRPVAPLPSSQHTGFDLICGAAVLHGMNMSSANDAKSTEPLRSALVDTNDLCELRGRCGSYPGGNVMALTEDVGAWRRQIHVAVADVFGRLLAGSSLGRAAICRAADPRASLNLTRIQQPLPAMLDWQR